MLLPGAPSVRLRFVNGLMDEGPTHPLQMRRSGHAGAQL